MTKQTRSLKELERMAGIYAPLTAKEEDRLARKAAKGDKEAMDLLLKHNARKILFFAKLVAFGGWKQYKESLNHYAGILSLDDAISETMFGFWKALRYFDPERHSPVAKKKVRFSSWANFIIRQHLHTVAIKTKKKQIREEAAIEALPSIINEEIEKEMAMERFMELLELLSEEDRDILYRGWQKTKAYKRALNNLKALATEEEWEDMKRVLF